MAHFGDLVGRKKMFTLSILLMALPTPAIGLLPTYSSVGIVAPLLLLLMRILQGAAIGGEVPGARYLSPSMFRKTHWYRLRHADGRPDRRHPAGIGGSDAYQHQPDAAGDPRRRLADPLPAGRRIWSGGDVSAPLAAGDADFLEMQQRKALAQELPVKAVVLKHQKAVAVSMLLTRCCRQAWWW